jgi:hypothetical protein
MSNKCYVCKETDGTLKHKISLYKKMQSEDVKLPICNGCYKDYKLFKKMLNIFMTFCTVFVMFIIVVIAYFFGMSGDKQTASAIIFFTLPTAILGYLLTRKMYNSSHFIQKAANEPVIKKKFDEGFTGFKISPL